MNSDFTSTLCDALITAGCYADKAYDRRHHYPYATPEAARDAAISDLRVFFADEWHLDKDFGHEMAGQIVRQAEAALLARWDALEAGR